MISIDLTGHPIEGTLYYLFGDHSFDTKGRSVSGYSCLEINSLQIELDEAGKLLYVWGYAPYEGWKEGNLSLPKYEEAALIYKGPLPVPGSSRRITETEYIPVLYDKPKKLVCIGNSSPGATAVMFAPGAVAVIEAGKMQSLWLSFRE